MVFAPTHGRKGQMRSLDGPIARGDPVTLREHDLLGCLGRGMPSVHGKER